MDIQKFTSNAPGRNVSITGGEYSFLPDDLPPNWPFPERLWPLLSEAKHQLGILEGVGRTLPNPGILLRPLEDREAIKSSRLEGTYVSATELLVFEMQPKEAKSDDDPTNQQREVFNYLKALHHWTNSDLPLSLRLLRELHATLLTGVRGKDRTPGEFRRIQVAIGTNYRFVPPPPEKLMECLDSLEKYFHVKNLKYDPLVDCFLVHYQFETIHPFIDGNGRVGRLLLAIMLMHRCGLSKPWLYMSEYYEKYREQYMERLYNVSAKAAWEDWVEFCLEGVVAQSIDTIQRCNRMQTIKDTFMSRLGAVGGSVRLNQIIEGIFRSPFIRISDLPEKLGVTYPTAKSDVERLVGAGILEELPNIFPKTYYSPEVFRIAYDKLD